MIVAFYTLGCKVNQYDTQTMMSLFQEAGYEVGDFQSYADIYVINTCTVTAVSDKKSRQMISRATKQNPNASIIVSGCYAQRDADTILRLQGVRLVIGNQNRQQIVSLIEQTMHEDTKINAVSSIKEADIFEELPAMNDGRTRAHLKIQDGCNRYCSYCIIPYARGQVRSRTLENIQEETRRLAREGFREIVLTGIHLSSYGTEMGHHLCDAIDVISSVDGIERIRLGSLEPMILDNVFVDYCANNKKVCQQFHVSMQSGSDSVLKRMNRRYTSREYANRIAILRQHMTNVAITTDVIAGFPAETLDEHEETKKFIQEIGFARIHVFPYSIRSGTVAGDMPNQLSKAEKEQRAKELIVIAKEMETTYLDSQIGSMVDVLVEEIENRESIGYTGNYIRVRLDTELGQGKIYPVYLTERVKEELLGNVVE